jgi:hypothetical protein
MDFRRVSLDKIVGHFQELEDPHSTINQRNPLPTVLVIVLLSVPAGVGGPTAIGRWAPLKKDLFLRVHDLPNGVPGADQEPRRVDPLALPQGRQHRRLLWGPRGSARAGGPGSVGHPAQGDLGGRIRRLEQGVVGRQALCLRLR